MEEQNKLYFDAVDHKVRVAIIGFGGMGGWHARKISSLKELELAGVYDIKPERAQVANEKGIHAFSSMQELLDDKSIELVTVAIPNHLHKDVCIEAMKAGKNVICEKPVALNHEELEEMYAAAEKYGVVFTIHQNRRWDEDFLIVKKLFEENTLGRIFRIESRVHGSRGIPSDWRNVKEYGGGMVLDWGVHLLDQILLMMPGKLKTVYATLSNVTNENCDDGFTAMLQFDSDVVVEVQVSTSNFVSLPRWYVLGENGTAVIENFKLDGKIVMVSDWENRDAVPVATAAGLTKTMAPRTSETIQEYPLPRVETDVRDFYRNVIRTIYKKADILVTKPQAMRVMKLMEAIFASAETNSVIRFED